MHEPILEEGPQITEESCLGVPLKRDPYGRDRPRHVEVKGEWSAEPLAKYLKDVAVRIDANLQNHCVPTAEKLDAFVAKLVFNTQRQARHAPRKVKHALQGMFTKRFRKFWDFGHNRKIRNTTPEELKAALFYVIESLNSEFGVSPESQLDQGWRRAAQV